MRSLTLLALFAGCATSPDAGATFHVRIDGRDCVSPVCGGAWISADDGHALDCSSQVTSGDECYVGTLTATSDQLSKLAERPVLGHFGPGTVAGGKDWGAFVVTKVE